MNRQKETDKYTDRDKIRILKGDRNISAVATYQATEATASVKFVASWLKVGYFQMLINFCE